MDRRSLTGCCASTCCPHTRGDGPWIPVEPNVILVLSPHAWGWTDGDGRWEFFAGVVPTRVGMDRAIRTRARKSACCPHTRGDGPVYFPAGCAIIRLSPHAWGWTDGLDRDLRWRLVVPTRVGMDRMLPCWRIIWHRCPHTRGDGPPSARSCRSGCRLSPHAWGWTVRRFVPRGPHQVVPTRVGMDRARRQP